MCAAAILLLFASSSVSAADSHFNLRPRPAAERAYDEELADRARAAVRSMAHGGGWSAELAPKYDLDTTLRHGGQLLQTVSEDDETMTSDLAQFFTIYKKARWSWGKLHQRAKRGKIGYRRCVTGLVVLRKRIGACRQELSRVWHKIESELETKKQDDEFVLIPYALSSPEELEAAEKIVEEKIAFAKKERGQVEIAYLDDDIRGVVRERPITMELEKVRVACNHDRVRLIFKNLIDNACAFARKETGEFSEILKIGVMISLSYDESRRGVVFIVEDGGLGISAEDSKDGKMPGRPRIFDLGVTLRKGGTGLGLYEAWRIVQDHEGSIEVESEEGKGTKFTVFIPFKKLRDLDDIGIAAEQLGLTQI